MSKIIQNIIEQELRQKSLLYPFISGITQREKAVLELRKQKKTLQEIGDKFKITRERVRQIETLAKSKLEYQAEIIERLAQRVGECVFTEVEIEQAFSNYLNENPPVDKDSTAIVDYSKMKLFWMDFNRWLWEGKKMLKGTTKNRINKGWFKKGHLRYGTGSLGKRWKLSDKRKREISETLKGRKLSKIHKENLSKAKKGRIGENSSNWQGGKTSINKRIRNSSEFRQWREAVFARDNWTCQECSRKRRMGDRVILHPHHIKSFAEYPELRLVVNNGITLCRECHMKIHNLWQLKSGKLLKQRSESELN